MNSATADMKRTNPKRGRSGGSLKRVVSPRPTQRPSAFKGDTRLAYRPGEDVNFKDAWVSRTERGVMCSVVNSKADLLANAKLCQVRLKWANAPAQRPPT